MRVLFASLLIFATVVCISSAPPQDKGKGRPNSLVENPKEHENPLQRRKPPVKIPGPKLTANEDNPGLSTPSPEKEQKFKKLAGGDKDKDKDNGKHKGKNLVKGERHNENPKEETQEERTSVP